MRRRQLIEIHDQTWFPGFLRDAVTDTLQFILNVGNLYRPIVPRLRRALEDAGTRRVVDLCSGGGGPWLRLYRIFEEEENFPVDVRLTDKYPNRAAFEQVQIVSRNKIKPHAEPLDARQIPPELEGFRTLFTSFHHFRPEEARAILQNAVDHQQGIGIFEIARRGPLALLLVFVVPVVALILVPFMRPFRWSHLIWAYLIPVIPLVLLFDGIVSCIRAYSPAELGELTERLRPNGYQWDIGEEERAFLPVPVTYLIGSPNRKQDVTNRK